MVILREFFSGLILINCILFALPLSVLFTWRMVYVLHIPFFSADAGQIYLVFVGLTFVVLRIFLFLLYLLGRREERK